MEGNSSVELSDEERTGFLGRGGTGVVSFPRGADESPYSLPVSYGYEPTEGQFYFRLAVGPDAGKEEFVGDATPVAFVTYDDTDEGWRSVVVTGTMEEIDESDLDDDVSEAMRQVEIPLVDVFDRDTREVSFRFYRLDPDEVSGRKEKQTGY